MKIKNDVRDHSSKGLAVIPKCALMWLICVELSRSDAVESHVFHLIVYESIPPYPLPAYNPPYSPQLISVVPTHTLLLPLALYFVKLTDSKTPLQPIDNCTLHLILWTILCKNEFIRFVWPANSANDTEFVFVHSSKFDFDEGGGSAKESLRLRRDSW